MKEPSKVATLQKALCFVVGPIGKDGSNERKHSDLLLHSIIKHVLQGEEFGYIVKRADEDADPGMIGDRIVSDIINAELVVADLTDLNPNVFYELGIRHSTEKPTIHIAKLGTPLPFDNTSHRTIFVDLTDWYSIEQARERLASSVHAVKAPDYRVSNPITQANASFKMRQSSDPRDQLIAEMNEKLSFLEVAVSRAAPPQEAERSTIVFRQLIDSLRAGQDSYAITAYCSLTGAAINKGALFVNYIKDRNRKIEAIKLQRELTGQGLKEAKDFVEAVMAQISE